MRMVPQCAACSEFNRYILTVKCVHETCGVANDSAIGADLTHVSSGVGIASICIPLYAPSRFTSLVVGHDFTNAKPVNPTFNGDILKYPRR